MPELYPEVESDSSDMLEVGDGRPLYWGFVEHSADIPAVLVHGLHDVPSPLDTARSGRVDPGPDRYK